MEVRSKLTADGSRVDVSCPAASLAAPVTSMVVYDVAGALLEVACGTAEFAETAVTTIIKGLVLDHEVSFQKGRLRLGSMVQRVREGNGVQVDRPHVAVWDDGTHSFYTHRYGLSAREILGLVSQFSVATSADGVAVTPRRADIVQAETHPPSALMVLRGVGLLRVSPLSAPVVRKLPAWRGTSVAGGELFVEGRGEPRMHYVMVSDSAVTQLIPHDKVNSAPALDVLASLQVTWHLAA